MSSHAQQTTPGHKTGWLRLGSVRLRRRLTVGLAILALAAGGVVAAGAAHATHSCQPNTRDSHGTYWRYTPTCAQDRWRPEWTKRNSFYIELVRGHVYTDSGSSIDHTYTWARVRGTGYSRYGYIAIELYDTYSGSKWRRARALDTRTYTSGADPYNVRTKFRACYLNSRKVRVQCTAWSW